MVEGYSHQCIPKQSVARVYSVGQFAKVDQKGCRTLDYQDNDLMIHLLCRLPRELRNRVYMFCVRGLYDNEVIIRRPTSLNEANVLLVRQPAGHCSYRWTEDPIHSVFNVSKLGLKVAKELLEAYYWTRTFKCSHRELSIIRPFLETDRYGLGLIPGYFIRRFQLQIQAEVCAQLDGTKAESAAKEIFGAIEALGSILTTRTEVDIDISLPENLEDDHDRAQTSPRVANIILEVTQAVKILKEEGLRVTVTCNKVWYS